MNKKAHLPSRPIKRVTEVGERPPLRDELRPARGIAIGLILSVIIRLSILIVYLSFWSALSELRVNSGRLDDPKTLDLLGHRQVRPTLRGVEDEAPEQAKGRPVKRVSLRTGSRPCTRLISLGKRSDRRAIA